jgi:tRNA A-37 threonylcarbamoyl transferase component Bud32
MASFRGSAFPRFARPGATESVTEDLEITCDLAQDHTEDLAPEAAEAQQAEPRIQHPVRANPAPRDAFPPRENRMARPTRERTQVQPSVAQVPAKAPSVSPEAPARPAAIAKPTQAAPTAPAPAPVGPTFVEPGVILHERFLIERQIGAGGHSTVFRARDLHPAQSVKTQTRVALKTPHIDRTDRARASARLRKEFECLQGLSHPNIVRTYEFFSDERECFMTMELLEGRTLASLQREWMPFPTALAYRVLNAAGQALLHAHERGVVHGDFTPGNVFVTGDEQVKVLDFGASVVAGSHDGEHAAAGTRAYASPEVLSGLPPDARDDLYSFACLAYELLVGRHPFDRKSSIEAKERELTPPRSGSLAAPQWFALVAALAWKRSERSISLEALLKTLQDSKPAPARPNSAPSVNRSFTPEAIAAARALREQPLSDDIWPRRNWGWLLFAACIIVMALLWFR